MTGEPWPLPPSVAALLVALLVVVVAGRKLTAVADALADRTGMGEALAGALLLGAVTSLPGIGTTVVGSLTGDAEFALANPIGGIAVQTVWLAIGDLLYRRSNLEHAAASLENVMQALVLIALLCVPVMAYATPTLRLGWIHPLSLLIPLLYGFGLVLVRRLRRKPMWLARETDDTQLDEPDEGNDGPRIGQLWIRMAGWGALVAGTGYLIGRGGLGVVVATGLPSGFVGFTVTTTITSVPELVTLIAAVRIGAPTLGVGGIIGGNAFDSLMIFLADATYLPGPIYPDAASAGLILTGATILLTVTLTAGLVMRERRGIGFEGMAIPLVYVGAVALLFLRSGGA